MQQYIFGLKRCHRLSPGHLGWFGHRQELKETVGITSFGSRGRRVEQRQEANGKKIKKNDREMRGKLGNMKVARAIET